MRKEEANTGEDEASHSGGTLIPPDEEEENGLEEPVPPVGPQNEQIPPPGPLKEQIQQPQRKLWKH